MTEKVSNLNGKSYAINVITPIKPWTTLIQKAIFWFVGVRPKTTARLVNLSFIHFARWVIVRKGQFPRLADSQPPENLYYDYLFFNSNFNGTWTQYIDAFSDVLPDGLNTIWNWSVKFPGARPEEPFIDYIRRHQLDVSHYYNAYPGASINDVKAAKNIAHHVGALDAMETSLSPEEFHKAYNRTLLRLQKHLGRLGPSPVAVMD